MPVALQRRGEGRRRVSSAAVRTRAERMLRALALDAAELSIVLCDDQLMRELNHRYRGLDRTTDVLAFEGDAGRPAGARAWLLGDVVISVPVAAHQAGERGARVLDEITVLLAHGLLHLLGFDHGTRAEERRMKARTDALVAAASRR